MEKVLPVLPGVSELQFSISVFVKYRVHGKIARVLESGLLFHGLPVI